MLKKELEKLLKLLAVVSSLAVVILDNNGTRKSCKPLAFNF